MYELMLPLKPSKKMSKEDVEQLKAVWNDLYKGFVYRKVRLSPWWKFWDVQYEERLI